MLADVPSTDCSKRPTLIVYFYRNLRFLEAIYKATIHVIILVKLAIYTAVLLFKDTTT